MKRFYKSVSVTPTENGYAVALDGKPIKTPGRRTLELAKEKLARAVAAEWDAQAETIRPAAMPVTRLVNTVIDGGREGLEAMIADLLSYCGTDLLCYRAAEPRGLVDRQEAQWQPLLDWAAEHLGVHLVTARGISPVEQPEEALQRFGAALSQVEGFSLGATHLAAGLTGSAVIAMALVHGRLDADEAWAAARVDEDWQVDQWGEDAEAADRAQAAKANLDAAVAVMRAMRQTD